jgi:type III secretory pathway component EscV
MSAFTLAAAAAIVGLVIGAALVPGAPIFALPIAAILIVALGAAEMRRRSVKSRSMQSFRDEADSSEIEFTARDKQTLAE